MSTNEQQKYQSVLEARAAVLAQALRHRQPIAVEHAPDAMDAVGLAEERDLAVRTLEIDYRLLRQIEAALARLKNGTYGGCLRCQERIKALRLDAVPWAAFCLKCQEDVDRLHATVNNLHEQAVSF